MRASFIKKGFIDPRRSDVMKINFNIEEELYKSAKPLGSIKYIDTTSFREKIKIKEINGCESWLEINGERFNHMSGNGPCPEYPIPEGDIVNLKINYKE